MTKSHREFLWDLLDDISTMDDVVKHDDAAYRAAVRRIAERRSEVAACRDGQSLEWRDDAPRCDHDAPHCHVPTCHRSTL